MLVVVVVRRVNERRGVHVGRWMDGATGEEEDGRIDKEPRQSECMYVRKRLLAEQRASQDLRLIAEASGGEDEGSMS